MKSRLSTPNDKLSVNKSKVVLTKSNSSVQISNRSATNLFFDKKLTTLQAYNSFFGSKIPGSHIGDANTHFKKSLRKYNEFATLKHTKWIKDRLKPKVSKKEHCRAAGDRKSISSIDLLADKVSEEELIKEEEEVIEETMSQKSKSNIPEDRQSITSKKSALKGTHSSIKEVKSEHDKNKQNEDLQKMLHESVEEIEKAVTKLEDSDSKKVKLDTASEKGTGDIAASHVNKQMLEELEATELQARATAEIITELKKRVEVLTDKDHMTDKEAQELEEMNKELIKQMALFEEKTNLIQQLMSTTDDKMQGPVMPKHKEEMLPKLVICGVTENNMPKILICDADAKGEQRHLHSGRRQTRSRGGTCTRYGSSEPSSDRQSSAGPCTTRLSCDRRQPSPCGVVPQIAKRLSESYDMQEKLAADNVELECKRYRLQEELVQKDKFLEGLQRKICSLQAEMRLVVKENSTLHDKLERLTGKCRSGPDAPCGSGAVGICPADVENRLQHYGMTTGVLEKQVEGMEGEVRRMQDELQQVRKERNELERQRKIQLQREQEAREQKERETALLQQQLQQQTCRPGCQGPCRGPSPGPSPGNVIAGSPILGDQQLRELREQYNRLQDDYKGKLTEVAGLRADNEIMRRTAAETDRLKKECENKLEEYEREMRMQKNEKEKLMGNKEMMVEQEQQLAVAKQRFREAQDELDELRACVQDQQAQLDDYRNKYLVAQQQVEEQRRQIDIMEMENQRISEQVSIEIQRVKNQFQEKLAELSPLPDILKATQLKLQEEQHLRTIADRNSDAVTRELQMYKDKLAQLMNKMEKQRNDHALGEDERITLLSKIAGWEAKCAELQSMYDKLKTEMARCQEQQLQNEKRMEEKLHEITQLTAQLENVREESARQVARTKERCEVVRRSFQGQISELERNLAQSRAAARAAQKERDDIRHKMTSQISQLKENFEESQMRIRNLQGHVNFLNTSYSSVFGGSEPMAVSNQQQQEEETICGCNYG